MKLKYVAGFLLVAGCVELNDQTAGAMSSQGLCDLTNPALYISTFAEREAAYKELESRGQRCGPGNSSTTVNVYN